MAATRRRRPADTGQQEATQAAAQAPFDPLAPCQECGEQYSRYFPPEYDNDPRRSLGAYGALLIHHEREHPDAELPPAPE